MIKCPECGAEYIVQPDICAQCGAQFDPEKQIQDLFAAARRQEQQSLAQQQAQREAFRKLHKETHSRELPEPETKSVPQPDALAAVPQETDSAEAEPVQKSRKWTLTAVAVMTVLILIAVFTLRDGFKEKRHPTDKYAFYLQDNALWFYRDDTGKKYLLTENETPGAIPAFSIGCSGRLRTARTGSACRDRGWSFRLHCRWLSQVKRFFPLPGWAGSAPL